MTRFQQDAVQQIFIEIVNQILSQRVLHTIKASVAHPSERKSNDIKGYQKVKVTRLISVVKE